MKKIHFRNHIALPVVTALIFSPNVNQTTYEIQCITIMIYFRIFVQHKSIVLWTQNVGINTQVPLKRCRAEHIIFLLIRNLQLLLMPNGKCRTVKDFIRERERENEASLHLQICPRGGPQIKAYKRPHYWNSSSVPSNPLHNTYTLLHQCLMCHHAQMLQT